MHMCTGMNIHMSQDGDLHTITIYHHHCMHIQDMHRGDICCYSWLHSWDHWSLSWARVLSSQLWLSAQEASSNRLHLDVRVLTLKVASFEKRLCATAPVTAIFLLLASSWPNPCTGLVFLPTGYEVASPNARVVHMLLSPLLTMDDHLESWPH